MKTIVNSHSKESTAAIATCAEQAHAELISEWEHSGLSPHQMDDEGIEKTTRTVVKQLFPEHSEEMKVLIVRRVLDRVLGLGPIEPLFRDPSVTEIMVNGTDAVFVERHGKLEKTDICFSSADEILAIMNHIVGKVGRRIDEANPYVDARLSDGSRVNAIISPLAIHGPTMTIRRFPVVPFTMHRLEEKHTLSPSMAFFLKAAIRAKQNILISGGTGSGKTSTLNAFSNCIPERERIITIEDAAEMHINHPHVVALESRPPNVEGRGEIPIRQLVKNALRMRPDRIIVGETRGGEALDMLQAMNTGHQGSLTTVHANAAEEALLRLETMALMADIDLPLSSIRVQIRSALDIVVQQERMVDGTRKIVSIHEVVKTRGEGETEMVQLFYYDKERGVFVATENVPSLLSRFAQYGVPYDLHWFMNQDD